MTWNSIDEHAQVSGKVFICTKEPYSEVRKDCMKTETNSGYAINTLSDPVSCTNFE